MVESFRGRDCQVTHNTRTFKTKKKRRMVLHRAVQQRIISYVPGRDEEANAHRRLGMVHEGIKQVADL